MSCEVSQSKDFNACSSGTSQNLVIILIGMANFFFFFTSVLYSVIDIKM